LLVREKEGVQVYYQANAAAPVFEEMKGLVLKTVGAGQLLRAALQPLRAEIVVAYLFGSLARGGQGRESDADVLIVSDTLSVGQVVGALRSVEARIGREVNPMVYRRAEFKSKLSRKQAFVTRVMSEPKVLLAGDARELG
jgi:predicted nucleotidyltransferase